MSEFFIPTQHMTLNYSNIEDSRDFEGPVWIYLSLAVIPLWILGGNVLVLLAVLLQRNLQNLSNRVIASLAVTDFLLGLIVVPFSIYQLILGRWEFDFYLCLVWTGSDVILSTASIMHLCAIALYRYRGIAHPLHVRGSSKGKHVVALVASAWCIALTLSIPFIIQGVLDPSHVLQRIDSSDKNQSILLGPQSQLNVDDSLSRKVPVYECGIFNQTFAIYSSLVSFFIPLGVMIFADIRSIQILRTHINFPLVGSMAASSAPPAESVAGGGSSPSSGFSKNRKMHSFREKIFSRRRNNSMRSISSMQSPVDDSIYSRDSDSRTPGSFSVTSQLTLATITQATCSAFSNNMKMRLARALPESVEADTDDASSRSSDSPAGTSGVAACNHGSPVRTSNRLYPVSYNNETSKSYPATSGNEVEINHASRRRSKSVVYFNMLASCGKTRVNGRERRAEKTLMWVFAAFVALWLPFFCTNLAFGLCGTTCNIPDKLFSVFTWLGYLSSGVNPCIYTLLNKDFRRAFKNLLLCRRETLRRSMYNNSINSIYVRSISNATV